MQTASKNSSAAPAWVWRFAFCLLGGAAYAGAVVYLAGLFDNPNIWLGGAGLALWAACAWMGWRRAPLAELAAAVTGLVWGGIVAGLLAMRLSEERPIPINWPGLLAVLAIVPLVVLITVLPFWFMARKPDAPAPGKN